MFRYKFLYTEPDDCSADHCKKSVKSDFISALLSFSSPGDIVLMPY